MPVNFPDIFNSLKQGVTDFAETSLKDFIEQGKSDGQAILTGLKKNLKKWTSQLANGEISADDLKFLVLGQKELIEMIALKQAGLLLVRIEEFRDAVLNLIVNTITSAVKL